MENIIAFSITSVVTSGLSAFLCNFIFRRRFSKKLQGEGMLTVLSLVLSIFGGMMFSYYEYSGIEVVQLSALVTILIFVAGMDQSLMIIPNEMVVVLLGTRVFLFLINELLVKGTDSIGGMDSVLGAVIIGGPFLMFRCVSKGSIGMGDIKLLAVIGLCVGSSRILIISVLALFTAVVVSEIKMVFQKIDKKTAFSFAPYITFGTILVMLMG